LNKYWTRHEADVHAHVGQRIKRARERAGLSHRELATRLGVTADHVARLEGGTERLTARRLFEIATIMGQSVSYFFADMEAGNGHGALADDDPAHGGPIGRLAETRELIAAFNRIPDADTRRDIIRLLRGIADDLRSQ
jgi:transcriptional regulator with XRE-family HTH domain